MSVLIGQTKKNGQSGFLNEAWYFISNGQLKDEETNFNLLRLNFSQEWILKCQEQ